MNRAIVGGVALWCAIAVAASTVAWVAIDQVGQEVGGPSPSVIPQSRSAQPTPSASTTPAPTRSPASASGRPSPSTSHSTPAVVPVAGTWSGTAGVVRATCTNGVVRLVSATPANGWRVEQAEAEAESDVEVRFESGESEVEVHVRCEAGRPKFEAESKD